MAGFVEGESVEAPHDVLRLENPSLTRAFILKYDEGSEAPAPGFKESLGVAISSVLEAERTVVIGQTSSLDCWRTAAVHAIQFRFVPTASLAITIVCGRYRKKPMDK